MQTRAFLLGGVLPTVLLGLGTVLMKLSMREGTSVANFLLHVGLAVLTVGLAGSWLGGGWKITPRGLLYATAMGLCWSVAIGAMAYGVSTLRIPLAVLAPLTNANALVALTLSLLIFREWEDLKLAQALTGTVLIIAGAAVVSTAKS
ncbi:hypothetical protein DW355_15325 [Hylemonella gracilis]|uniref:EamA domain-containing protein n=1 Tax=Hylemonella gracilis TaxID=80880 RepID=A0A4P6UMG9_9BURK|nr:hypothetical protein [Hylemonella gracilis]QBK05916.1 hypothetical protein DW355_15325 [Hylemonella gracilis]